MGQVMQVPGSVYRSGGPAAGRYEGTVNAMMSDPDSLMQMKNQREQFGETMDWQKNQFGQQQAAQRYGTDLQAALAREGNSNQARIAQMQADASKYPHILKQQRWNQLFPSVQGMLTNPGQFLSQYNTSQVSGSQPTINAAPIYSGQQTNEAVNAMRAKNDRAMMSRQEQLSREAAGRGAGANSPLVRSMREAMYGRNLAANTSAEQGLRFDVAGQNAKHLLAAQQAQEDQYGRRQNEGIERGKVGVGALTSILGSLMGSI